MSYGEQIIERRIEAAEARANQLEKELEEVKAELEQTKAAVAWHMKPSRIIDLMFASDDLPFGGTHSDQASDTARLDWVNLNGRVHRTGGGICIVVPLNSEESEVPTPFNVRHIIDACRLEKL